MRLYISLFTLALCSCKRLPCEEIDVSNLSINTFFETPSFSWVGSNINSLIVQGPSGEELWTLSCQGSSLCIPSPIEYGTLPAEVIEELTAAPASAPDLSSGETYSLEISIKCRGDFP